MSAIELDSRRRKPLPTLQVILAFLAVAFVVLLIAANLGCAPMYFQRADVVAALVLAVTYALVLGWACLVDDDVRRVVGATASAGLATLFLSSASIPVLAVPVAVAAIIRRLPRSGRTRWILGRCRGCERAWDGGRASRGGRRRHA